MKPFLSIGLFLTFLTGYSQNSFVKIYDFSFTSWGWSIKQTIDHGYIITGFAYASNQVPILIKTNENGEEIWKKTYFDQTDCHSNGYNVFESDDGGFYVFGSSVKKNTDDYCPFMLKTDSEGNEKWTKYFGNDVGQCNAIVQDKTGNFVLGCYKWGILSLVKITKDGELLWVRKPFNEEFYCNSIIQAEDNGYVLVGSGNGVTPGDGLTCALVIKTDFNGNFELSHKFCQYVHTRPESICLTSDGGFIITGTAENYKENFYDSADLFLYKLNSSGKLLWSKTYGDYYSNNGGTVIETYQKGLLLVGDTWNSSNNTSDAYLIKADENGDSIWSKKINVANNEFRCRSVQLTKDSGFVFTGFTRDLYQKDNVFIVKTDKDGKVPYPYLTSSKNVKKVDASIYPNPANDYIEIHTNFSVPFDLEIFDVNGKSQFHKTCYNKRCKIELEDFSNGIYFIKFSNKSSSLLKSFIRSK